MTYPLHGMLERAVGIREENKIHYFPHLSSTSERTIVPSLFFSVTIPKGRLKILISSCNYCLLYVNEVSRVRLRT